MSKQFPREPLWLEKIQNSEHEYKLVGEIPTDLIFFDGHFDDFPLVPGVVQLQWVEIQIAQCFGIQQHLLQVINLKFQRFFLPNDKFILHLQWNKQKNSVRFKFNTPTNESYSSGTLLFDTP